MATKAIHVHIRPHLFSLMANYNEPTATALDLSEYADILDALNINHNDNANKSEYVNDVEVSDLKQYVSGNLQTNKHYT